MEKYKENNKIEKLLKQARLADSQTVKVDKQFKDELKETLYREHLNNLNKNSNNRIMKI